MDERKIKEAVNSIEMSKAMASRLKMNCADQNQKRSRPIHFSKWASLTSVFTILLLVLLIGSLTNYNSKSHLSNFTITAYAADSTGRQLLADKTIFDLGTLNRRGIISMSGGGYNLIFTDVSLQVSGEKIDSILYEIDHGSFIEDVVLSKEQVANKEQLALEKINHIMNEPNSDIFYAIKDIGNRFTVKYNEQQRTKYTLAIPHEDGVIEEDVEINVTVTYTDGTSEQQTILVNQEDDAVSLVLNQ